MMKSMNRLLKANAALLTGAVLACMLAPSVSANSAQRYWLGTDATGAIVTDTECPIVVEHEKLTFYLEEFPLESGYESFHDYRARVEAVYDFYNPSDYTVKATLVFPFGRLPSYGSYNLYSDSGMLEAHRQMYTVDGMKYFESDGLTVRHTFVPLGSSFKLEVDMSRLHDGFMEHEFYSPEMTVTRYTYMPTELEQKSGRAPTAALRFDADPFETRILLERPTGKLVLDETNMILTPASEGKAVHVYAIGEPFETLPDWKLYENNKCETEVGGSMTLTETETMTLKDYALTHYKESSGVLDYDWYNAVITQFIMYDANSGHIIIKLDLTEYLMRWYQYELELAPGERVRNTVVAPMYPTINEGYEPPTYEYTYLLSPAKTWADFGTLEIVVNTDAFMLEHEKNGFTQINFGYYKYCDGLPDGELAFTLCDSQEPKKINNGISPLLLIPAAAVVILVGTVVTVSRKRTAAQ